MVQTLMAHNQRLYCFAPYVQSLQVMIGAGLIPAAWAGSAEERSFIMVRCKIPSSMHPVLECRVTHAPSANMSNAYMLTACS